MNIGLLVCDLVGEEITRESIKTLRADIADIESRLDELHLHGSDSWLDVGRQIPPPPADGQAADAGILAPFPTISAAYEADPDFYGLPVSVRVQRT